MTPQFDQIGRSGDTLVGAEQHPLEDVGEIAEVEDVVKLDCCWRKYLGDFGVKLQRGIDNGGAHLLDLEAKLVAWVFDVVGKYGIVYGDVFSTINFNERRFAEDQCNAI